MTNRERFIQTFGFDPDSICVMPENVCPKGTKAFEGKECKDCPYDNFWETDQQITEEDYHESEDGDDED